jgi:hypothetical protein
MNKVELESLRDRYRRLEEKHYTNYQESGIPRYGRNYQLYQQIADAAEQALSAAEDHQKSCSLMSTICDIGSQAEKGLHSGEHTAAENALREILAHCKVQGFKGKY